MIHAWPLAVYQDLSYTNLKVHFMSLTMRVHNGISVSLNAGSVWDSDAKLDLGRENCQKSTELALFWTAEYTFNMTLETLNMTNKE